MGIRAAATEPPHTTHLQVNIGLRVLTRPDPVKLPDIYRQLGTDYAERVLPSIIQVGRARDLRSGGQGHARPGAALHHPGGQG